MTRRYPFKAPKAQTPERVPRIARLLALAHKFQGMLDRGDVESMAELARLGRVSRARITQIMDLLMLAPEIQEEILFRTKPLPLRDLMRLARAGRWVDQRAVWRLPKATELADEGHHLPHRPGGGAPFAAGDGAARGEGARANWCGRTAQPESGQRAVANLSNSRGMTPRISSGLMP